MKLRAQRARRILDVQTQLHRLEELRMAELRQRRQELETAQRDLIGALNQDDALHGLFVDTMARRLGSLSEQANQVGREEKAQAVKLLERAIRAKHAARISEKADQASQAEDERRRLLEISERFVKLAASASRKFVNP